MRLALPLIFLLTTVSVSRAQVTDTTISWKDYSRVASARVVRYPIKNDKKRSFAIVIDELAENRGSPATTDARFVIQKIARDFGIDPTTAYWIFRWTTSSFVPTDADAKADKQLLIMATMGRSKTSTLTGPSWKIILPDRLMDLTDRQWTN